MISQAKPSSPGNLGLLPLALMISSASAQPLFTPVAAELSGIDYQHHWVTPEDWTALNSYAPMAGVAMADYDGDGRLDLFLGNQTDGGSLYRNLGDFRFENATSNAGLKLEGTWTTGTTFADVNNDGFPDLFLGRYKQANALFINNGDGTFRDASEGSGLDFSGATTMGAFCDYDRDGDLDCYLLTYRLPSESGMSATATLVDGKLRLPEEVREFKNIVYDKTGMHHVIDSGQRDYLFENDGKGGFKDVTRKMGLHGHTDPGLSSVWWDADNNMWPDLYVSSDFHSPDHLWMNFSGKGFKDQHGQRFPHQPWFSMGSDFADLNGDGLFDYVTTDMSPSSHYRSKLTMGDMSPDAWFLDHSDPPQMMRNAVFINAGSGHFFELAQMLKLSSTDWTWAVRAEDLDCDGRQDLFFSTGMTRDFENSDHSIALQKLLNQFPKDAYTARTNVGYHFWKDLPSLKEDNFAFKNVGDLTFKSVAEEWGLSGKHVSSGVGIGDLDNDGDPDLVVMNFDESPSIYRNNSISNRLKVRLQGSTSNRDGIGARLILTRPDGTEDHRFVSLSRGFLSSSGPETIFGLGEQTGPSSLRILWPSGKEQVLSSINANQTLTIDEEQAGPATGNPITPTLKPLFAASPLLDVFAHRENLEHDEFVEEPLLPQRVSQLGPGLALGDLNRDGIDDIVLSGASGLNTYLAYLTPDGLASIAPSQKALDASIGHEDLAPLIFDADRDGDLDLLITSGGSEAKNGDALLRDRLFLNSGNGILSAAPEGSLPDLRFSSGPAAVADYDRDGDLDLFIGGRINPGAYPTTPRSALLRNDSSPGKVSFVDVTSSLAPDLMKPGMVTSALWSDADDDGWLDLLLTLDWGPVSFFQNEQGKRLSNRTEGSGLADQLGWFNSISGGDIDHDGDIDYVVGNFGRNTKYHPTHDAPTRIYYGNFDESGKGQIVEAAIKDGTLLPVRGKSCSQNAMPFIQEKFPTYKAFASQKLVDIYPKDKLAGAKIFEATTLDSLLLVNQGDGKFDLRPLPALAQAAPVFGSTLTDFDGDTHLDLVLAQNFYGPQRETGRFDGGLSLVLLGDGSGHFTPLWPNQSGISVKADATALVVGDLNRDQRPDLVIATNNGPTRAFLNQASTKPYRTLKLKGPAGNPSAIGARLTIERGNGPQETIEVTGGGGYLSQSSASHFLADPEATPISKVTVVWPDGTKEVVSPTSSDPLTIDWEAP